jgi:hypothetical protein
VAAEHDLDWALQGSYALRQGVAGMDEVYGVLDWSWTRPRNATLLARVQALQRPLRGPGYTEALLPYAELFHPLTGLCAVRPAGVPTTLKLGPCNATDAWAYVPPASTLVLRDAAAKELVPCLRADGRGHPARLTAAACGDAMSTWRLVSDSGMHVAVDVAAPGRGMDGDGMLCLDVGEDGRSVVTNPCACLRGGGRCDPERQWFKLVTTTSAQTGHARLAPVGGTHRCRMQRCHARYLFLPGVKLQSKRTRRFYLSFRKKMEPAGSLVRCRRFIRPEKVEEIK